MSVSNKFGGKLYHYRDDNELTQKEMAALCDVSLRHYQDLEIGKAAPRLEKAVYISCVLGFSLDSFKDEISQIAVEEAHKQKDLFRSRDRKAPRRRKKTTTRA
ncbi:MAG TPA: helix-turn-helix transcriptional regulator [Candidatus Gallacutalibacter stercoravium]|nr:helix-turn-helix transcriptional regulator [Candidatus Gallacutalibacter stercoravium]